MTTSIAKDLKFRRTNRLAYLRRVFAAYLTRRKSHLTFWHGVPEVNPNMRTDQLGEYYMSFVAKADYPGDYDSAGIPMLDYQGEVGLQYNPIAIAQYGLGNFNLYRRGCRVPVPEYRDAGLETRDAQSDTRNENPRFVKFLKVADWLVENLEDNDHGLGVWKHHFDWEYRTPLKAGWYSALSQGQGISLLLRAHTETSDKGYLKAAERAFETFKKQTDEGGVTCIDEDGYSWFEETVVDPPTHILNGFFWASWGIYDYWLHTGSEEAGKLFSEAVRTLKNRLQEFDVGFWSLYEQSGTRMKMLASPFYHRLHIVQLRVMHRLTGESLFNEFADRWEDYRRSTFRRYRALIYKAIFKLIYY